MYGVYALGPVERRIRRLKHLAFVHRGMMKDRLKARPGTGKWRREEAESKTEQDSKVMEALMKSGQNHVVAGI